MPIESAGKEEASLPPALQPDHVPTEQCDLVLTGGVSSGIVYPWAILELARVYRFKSIGGSSVGALAAALTAAAEYQRRNRHINAGFEVLRRLPQELAATRAGGTTMLSLFQPAVAGSRRLRLQPGTDRLFRLFVTATQSTPRSGWLRLGLRFVREYWLGALPGVLLCLLLYLLAAPCFGWPGPFYGLLGYAWAALLSMAWHGWVDLRDGLPKNNYGLCDGGTHSGDTDQQPGLTQWLHNGIQAAAGRSPGEPPLCFGDLSSDDPDLHVRLEMVTTNLTHGRPYRLPLPDASSRLFFKPAELQGYFPDAVLQHLRKVSVPYAARNKGDPAGPYPEHLELPMERLPLVVAARLSLSFPLLFSAVPLWAIDYERPVGQRVLQRCWFSDGGLCSNFPIHFFDSLLPQHPTFGIFLGKRSRFWEQQPVWLPEHHSQGKGDSWDRFGDEAGPGSRLLGFLLALLGSAKDWKDLSLMRMPGVRDRVVRIGFLQGEGALNIGMSGPTILRLAQTYGTPAGKALVERFSTRQDGRPARGWAEHRWVRLMVTLDAFGGALQRLRGSLHEAQGAAPLRQQIAQAFLERPLQGSYAEEAALSAEQADAIDEMLQALELVAERFERPRMTLQPYRPEPQPTLGIGPLL